MGLSLHKKRFDELTTQELYDAFFISNLVHRKLPSLITGVTFP